MSLLSSSPQDREPFREDELNFGFVAQFPPDIQNPPSFSSPFIPFASDFDNCFGFQNIATLIRENEEAKATIETQKRRLNWLTTEKNELEKAVACLNNDKFKLQAQNGQLQAEMVKLVNTNAGLITELEFTKKDFKLKRGRTIELVDQLQDSLQNNFQEKHPRIDE
jgi:hypothetical protein